MNDLLLSIYHRLPGPARSAAASLRGYYLRRWRFGGNFDELVEQALARERWSAERWAAWRGERLAFLLERAATRVPFYRDMWARRRRAGDQRSWTELGNWPIVEKDDIRADADAFVADDRDPKKLYHLHTSGTTGKPLELYQTPDSVRGWHALFEARCRRWHDVSRHSRWATIGGQLVTPVSQRRPPFWVWNAALNQLYMSSYHLAPDLIPAYLDALVKYRIECVEAYPSSLYALAQEAKRHNRRDIALKVAITNAEPVFDYQRELIADVFGCPVRETYGMAESVASASECAAGRLHLWPEVGITEIVDGKDQFVTDGSSGDLICTGLLNDDMPLIRYRIGDRGHLEPGHGDCSCGRTLPVAPSIEGRQDDVLYTRDGRRIGRLDPIFKADIPIREAQIVQESLERVRVIVAPDPGFDAAAGKSIAERLRDRMGDIDVVIEEVDEIPRTKNGKFRAVVSRVEAPGEA